MPIDLFSIPAHIRDSVIQKFDLSHFRKFHQSSQKAYNASKNIKTKFVLENRTQMGRYSWKEPVRVNFSYVHKTLQANVYKLYDTTSPKVPVQTDIVNFPLRFEDACGRIFNTLTGEYCSAITNFLFHTNSTMDDVILTNKIDCSPERLRQLVEIGKFKHMRVYQLLSPEFLALGAIKNIVELVIQKFVDEAKIIALDATMFHINSSNLTSTGINLILKELLSGKRMIKDCTIYTDEHLKGNIMFEGIPIATTVYFSAETHISFFGGKRAYKVCYNNRLIQIQKTRG